MFVESFRAGSGWNILILRFALHSIEFSTIYFEPLKDQVELTLQLMVSR
jgi:hypothetical protein